MQDDVALVADREETTEGIHSQQDAGWKQQVPIHSLQGRGRCEGQRQQTLTKYVILRKAALNLLTSLT